MDITEYKPGDLIRVSFGSKGTKKAEVTSSARDGKHGIYIKAKKYSAKGDEWSKPIPVYASEILGLIRRK